MRDAGGQSAQRCQLLLPDQLLLRLHDLQVFDLQLDVLLCELLRLRTNLFGFQTDLLRSLFDRLLQLVAPDFKLPHPVTAEAVNDESKQHEVEGEPPPPEPPGRLYFKDRKSVV